MTVQHISEVLNEFFQDRSGNLLDFIRKNSYDTFVASGRQPELAVMIEMGYLGFAEIYMVSHENMVNGLWRN